MAQSTWKMWTIGLLGSVYNSFFVSSGVSFVFPMIDSNIHYFSILWWKLVLVSIGAAVGPGFYLYLKDHNPFKEIYNFSEEIDNVRVTKTVEVKDAAEPTEPSQEEQPKG